MKHYYIDRDATQSRPEVHASWCPAMKSAVRRDYIGLFADPRKAVSTAGEKGYGRACGCVTLEVKTGEIHTIHAKTVMSLRNRLSEPTII